LHACLYQVTDFVGKYVKDADRDIITYLRGKGRLIQDGNIDHSYPHCWRSGTAVLDGYGSWVMGGC
jgi:isoleucyl-tRNA synthetase